MTQNERIENTEMGANQSIGDPIFKSRRNIDVNVAGRGREAEIAAAEAQSYPVG